MKDMIPIGLAIIALPLVTLAVGTLFGHAVTIRAAKAFLFGFCLPLGGGLVSLGVLRLLALRFFADRIERARRQIADSPLGRLIDSHQLLSYAATLMIVPMGFVGNGVLVSSWSEIKFGLALLAVVSGFAPSVVLFRTEPASGKPSTSSFVFVSVAIFALSLLGLAVAQRLQYPPAPDHPEVRIPQPAQTSKKLSPLWLSHQQLDKFVADLHTANAVPMALLDCPAAEPAGGQAKDDTEPPRADKLTAEEVEKGVGECEEIEADRSAAYDEDRRLVTARWLPAITSAAGAGDPIAEVILRICSTAPLLDRTGIVSTCSSTSADQFAARLAINALSFPAARVALDYESPPTPLACPDSGQEAGLCRLQDDLKHLRASLIAIESGYLGAVVPWTPCEPSVSSAPRAELLTECRTAYQRLKTVIWTTRRSYSKGLSLVDRFHGGRAAIGDPEPISEGAKGDANLPTPARDEEAVRIAAQIDQRIAADLAADPRWRYFLND